jgi:hypothetical protein
VTCRSLCRAGPTAIEFMFRLTAPVPVRVGGCEPEHGDHRRVARASGGPRKIRAAQQDNHSTATWAGRRRAGNGTASAGLSREPSGWANFAKKDNPGRRYCTNPAGLFGWFHGVPVGPRLTRNKKGFFSLSGAATRTDVSTVPKRWIGFVYAAASPSCSAFYYLTIPIVGILVGSGSKIHAISSSR